MPTGFLTGGIKMPRQLCSCGQIVLGASHLFFSTTTRSHTSFAGVQLLQRCGYRSLFAVEKSRIKHRRRRSYSARAGTMAGIDAFFSSHVRKDMEPIVIEAKGKHLVTFVWLHGRGDTAHGWADLVAGLPLAHVKWILPTAPVLPNSYGPPCTAWFEMVELEADVESIDRSAALVASLLQTNNTSSDGTPVKLAVGGFSMGGATSLHTATRSVLGTCANGKPLTVSLDAVVCLSGWLPGLQRLTSADFSKTSEVSKKLETMPIYIAHGTADCVINYKFGLLSKEALQAAGFKGLTLKSYPWLEHSTSHEELSDLVNWLKETLSLDC